MWVFIRFATTWSKSWYYASEPRQEDSEVTQEEIIIFKTSRIYFRNKNNLRSIQSRLAARICWKVTIWLFSLALNFCTLVKASKQACESFEKFAFEA